VSIAFVQRVSVANHIGVPPEGEERGVYRSRSPWSTAFLQMNETLTHPGLQPLPIRRRSDELVVDPFSKHRSVAALVIR
jgi:hypothetical protein